MLPDGKGPASPDEDARAGLIRLFAINRGAAHAFLFSHRHPDETPPFHGELIEAIHSAEPRVLIMVFRGGAKSTLLEEAVIIAALLGEVKNVLIIGETETRAKDRLRAIKHEVEANDRIREVFGDCVGPQWGELRLELPNGCLIQAYGRGQSLRGVKHLDRRPDFILCDDIEDEESVRSPENRKRASSWFYQVLLAACADPARTPVRVAATPLHEEALAVQLSRQQGWRVIKVPVESVDQRTGERVSNWPSRFPAAKIDELKSLFARAGKGDLFAQEYQLEPIDPASRLFSSEMFRYEPIVRTYQPVFAVYDPARTVKDTSAHTGHAVGSWVGNRLVVWEAGARRLLPDQIIADLFRVDDTYRPIVIGVEEDGLNQFLLQPIRHAQLQRGHPLPLRPLKAPRGKSDFIRSLQPFFAAREVVFAGAPDAFNELTSQLLNFSERTTGNVDAPNALAYFLKLRPGLPVYDTFNSVHIVETPVVERSPILLALNADGAAVTGVVLQYNAGRLSIIDDFVREGDPGAALEGIVKDAKLSGVGAIGSLRCYAPPRHFTAYDTLGLRAACAGVPIQLHRGAPPSSGRPGLADLFGRNVRGGLPAVRVAATATWTLRALQGGYARALTREGVISDKPVDNVYATVMEAVESIIGSATAGMDDNEGVRYDVTSDGRRFISARPNK